MLDLFLQLRQQRTYNHLSCLSPSSPRCLLRLRHDRGREREASSECQLPRQRHGVGLTGAVSLVETTWTTGQRKTGRAIVRKRVQHADGLSVVHRALSLLSAQLHGKACDWFATGILQGDYEERG